MVFFQHKPLLGKLWAKRGDIFIIFMHLGS